MKAKGKSMKTFEKEYIDLVVKHAKRKHMSKERAFSLTGLWSYRCMNRVKGKMLDLHTGEPLSSKARRR